VSKIRYPSDVAFSSAVKIAQAARGSRPLYAKMEQTKGWRTTVTPDLADFLAEVRSVYLATASADGQPYVQHRGGPPGFIRVLDEARLGFADFSGNRQYISVGNLSENPHAQLFIMDYINRRRVKIWGTAHFVEDDKALLRQLTPENYRAKPERALIFRITAWDINCPQHIPKRFEAEDVERALAECAARIAELEAKLSRYEDPSAQKAVLDRSRSCPLCH
jgi:predicted pyridoxine 5'-phosphate oxidase superfamily flavin-nucleotide-binding protein